MNRTIGTMITLVWLAAMAALVHRDVLPFWTAEDAPAQSRTEGRIQIGIMGPHSRRIGTSWIITSHTTGAASMRTMTVVDMRKATSLLPGVGQLLLEADSTFGESDRLEQFRFHLDGIGVPAEVSLDRYGEDFACSAKLGALTTTLSLDGRVSEFLTETIHPFTNLPHLHVGQRWRLRMLDPLSLLQGGSPEFRVELANVTRRETIRHQGREVDCYRVETDGAVAWATEEGSVIRQEVELPILGRWVLLDEPYDNDARLGVLSSFKRR